MVRKVMLVLDGNAQPNGESFSSMAVCAGCLHQAAQQDYESLHLVTAREHGRAQSPLRAEARNHLARWPENMEGAREDVACEARGSGGGRRMQGREGCRNGRTIHLREFSAGAGERTVVTVVARAAGSDERGGKRARSVVEWTCRRQWKKSSGAGGAAEHHLQTDVHMPERPAACVPAP